MGQGASLRHVTQVAEHKWHSDKGTSCATTKACRHVHTLSRARPLTRRRLSSGPRKPSITKVTCGREGVLSIEKARILVS